VVLPIFALQEGDELGLNASHIIGSLAAHHPHQEKWLRKR